jgi:hypothetical protein
MFVWATTTVVPPTSVEAPAPNEKRVRVQQQLGQPCKLPPAISGEVARARELGSIVAARSVLVGHVLARLEETLRCSVVPRLERAQHRWNVVSQLPREKVSLDALGTALSQLNGAAKAEEKMTEAVWCATELFRAATAIRQAALGNLEKAGEWCDKIQSLVTSAEQLEHETTLWYDRGVRQRSRRRQNAALKAVVAKVQQQPALPRVLLVPPHMIFVSNGARAAAAEVVLQLVDVDVMVASRKTRMAKRAKVVPPGAVTALEAVKQLQRQGKPAKVAQEDPVFGSVGKRAVEKQKAAGGVAARKYITRVLPLDKLRDAPVVKLLGVGVFLVQFMEGLLVAFQRSAPLFSSGIPLSHPAVYETLCTATVAQDGSVVLSGAVDFLDLPTVNCVTLQETEFLPAMVFGCSRQQLEGFVSRIWSQFSPEAKAYILGNTYRRQGKFQKGVLASSSNMRSRVCLRVAGTAFVTHRRLVVRLVGLIGMREIAGNNSHLVSEKEMFIWLGVAELVAKLEKDIDNESGVNLDTDQEKGKDARINNSEPDDEAKAARQEMRKCAPKVAREIAELFVWRTLKRGADSELAVADKPVMDLATCLSRWTTEAWKASLQKPKKSDSANAATSPDYFLSLDLVETIKRLDAAYHRQPTLGMLRHKMIPEYATARSLHFDNKSLLEVLHLQGFDFFKKGRTVETRRATGDPNGFRFELKKAAEDLEEERGGKAGLVRWVERHFGEFVNAKGVLVNGASSRLFGVQERGEIRRRPTWAVEQQLRKVKDVKITDLISPAWTLHEWAEHCTSKYGSMRSFSVRPNKDADNGAPGRGMVYASVMCDVFKNCPNAGFLLYAANLIGADFGQHHVVHFALRAGDQVGSLWGSGRDYSHKTKRSLNVKLGEMAAALQTPETTARLAANQRLTERFRCGGVAVPGDDGGTVPEEAFFAAATPADFSFKIELEKATEEEVVKYALAWVRRLREYYDKLGRFENIVVVLGKEFTSVGRGQAVANCKRIAEILSDHFLVVLYNENYSSQLHYACGRPMEQYRDNEVRTKICYCCTAERQDGRHVLVNRDFNAAMNMANWFCYELQYGQRPLAACGLKRFIAPIQGDDNLPGGNSQ